ncbi:MAG: DUF2842 domain-containing protein [Alphaproteobacteria bacterium]|nr:DUF2842 domain-containing protein [Alphaproteobacteria bacterium]
MNRRTKKLIGAAAMIIFVIVYALAAMALAQSRLLQEASKWVQTLFYAALGLGWIVPMFPLIKWMERDGK